MAEQRNYRDFRDDAVIQIRQFQVALKKLRLLSCREDGPKTELNVEKTIEKTCDEGGRLELVMERPRKNQTKLLLLMDSGGSMWAYADLCNRLFQAVNQSSHFKDLKIIISTIVSTISCLRRRPAPGGIRSRPSGSFTT